jgi:hypothetical protein
MTSSSRTSLSALPRGHELASTTFSISAERVRAYLRAVGDVSDYGDTVPPLAVVALALASVQDEVSLPEGALHTGQDVQHGGTIPCGQTLTLRGRIAQRSERQGFIISVLEVDIDAADGAAIRARTTIMAPGGGS